jgi:hypothetical protein
VDGEEPGQADVILARLDGGSRLAGYRLEERIGAGGMAVVFRARDMRLDRTVALKVLIPALATDEDFRERFLRESRAAAAVDDPHTSADFHRVIGAGGGCGWWCGLVRGGGGKGGAGRGGDGAHWDIWVYRLGAGAIRRWRRLALR